MVKIPLITASRLRFKGLVKCFYLSPIVCIWAMYILSNTLRPWNNAHKLLKDSGGGHNSPVTSAGGDMSAPPDRSRDQTRSMKTILFWNEMPYNSDLFGFGLGHKPFVTHGCRVSDCRTTTNRALLSTADAVFIHGKNQTTMKNPKTFPKHAHPKQIFIYFNLESPLRGEDWLLECNDMFNLTMTYRADSDIETAHVAMIPRPRNDTYTPLNSSELAKKTKTAIWIISHCDKTGSIRWQYGTELAKYVDLDIFGDCGKPLCPKGKSGMRGNCLEMTEAKYKFYISFENSVCRDYVTEKLHKALTRNIVPVTLGGWDYHANLPLHSFIHVDQFRSPRELARYLKYLDRNDEDYLNYFKWKKRQLAEGLGPSRIHGFCKLCEILHNDTYSYKSHFDIDDWWNTQAKCVDEEQQARKLGLQLGD